MLQDTLHKFGYPQSLIKSYQHWYLLARPAQITLGSMILIYKEEVHQYSLISVVAQAEQRTIVADIEQRLKAAFQFDKINYLMLMMVDPEVHFHILPRYAESRSFGGQTFLDYGWPGLPDFKQANKITLQVQRELIQFLQSAFGGTD